MKKRILLFAATISILTGAHVFNNGLDASASNFEDDYEQAPSVIEKIIEIPLSEIEEMEKQMVEEIEASYPSLNETNPNSKTPTYESKTEKVGTQVATKQLIGWAGNQPANGTVLNKPGSLFWQDGGYTASVGITVGFGSFSLNVPRGQLGSTGVAVNIPANVPYKLQIHKDITVTKWAVYQRPFGSTGGWSLLGYSYTSMPTKNYVSAIKS